MPLFRYAAIVLLLLSGGYAQAAPGDTCTVGGMPGTEDAGSVCVAVTTPDYGIACGTGYYYNGTSCDVTPAAAYDSCTDASHPGYYYNGAACVANPTDQGLACQASNGNNSTSHFFNGNSCVANGATLGCPASQAWANGQCVAQPIPPTTPSVPAPAGELADVDQSLGAVVPPQGNQQPICINSAPSVGFIVGSVLCYGTAADLSGTGIYAYHTQDPISHGLGIIQTNTWDGLNLKELFATGNVTTLGQQRNYGGSITYSPDKNTGLAVVDGKVLAVSSDGGNNNAALSITPTQILQSVSSGPTTGSSLKINASEAALTSNNGANIGALSVTANKITGSVTTSPTIATGLEIDAHTATLASQNANNIGGLSVASNKVASSVTDGIAIANQELTAEHAKTLVINGGNTGLHNVSSNNVTSRVTNSSDSTDQLIEADQASLTSTDGTNTGSQTLTATSALSQISSSTGLSRVSSTATGTTIITQNDLGNAPTNYTSIDSSTTQIINRANSGNNYTQTTASSGNYIIEASNSAITSRVNVDSSNINLISGYGGTMATNGTSGTTSGIGSGAMQIHQSSQTIGQNTTIGNLLAGKTYQNKVNGNLFVDGNVYINGTLEYVSSNAATTTVTSTAGSSILGANLSTSGGTAVVMKDTDATHATVDRNGKIALTPGVSAQSSSAMTLTNGYGNTHGFIVNETQATMSGGINSSSLTLNDNGATFSNSATGRPIQVHGVADGTADFDAVNVRQLRQTREQLAAGIAGISAMSNIPNVDTGKQFSLGAGVGHFQNTTSLAIGSSFRVNPNTVIRATVAGTDGGSSRSTTYGLGVGVSW